jgi:D-alanyl-D-alanine carboxypeptidase
MPAPQPRQLTRQLTRRLVPLLAVALLVTTAAAAHIAFPGSTNWRLQPMLDHWRQRAGIPAVTVAVHGPRGSDAAASGTTERGGTTPVPVDAQFRVASITKMFVATVVLQLVQEGRIRLDDLLTSYLPEFRQANGASIRQLLNHTSGIPDYERVEGLNEDVVAHRDRRWSTQELLHLISGVRPEFLPGTDTSYSNTDYLLLGSVIERVTGSTWPSQVRRRILDPLGLRRTYVSGAERVPGGVVPGYMDIDQDGREDKVESGQGWPALDTTEAAAGAIVSTAPDLAAFATALFHHRLLNAATLQQMVTESQQSLRTSGYGLGVEIIRPDYRLTMLGHGGFTIGTRSALWYAPAEDVVVAVLANDAQADPHDLAELVVRARLFARGGA